MARTRRARWRATRRTGWRPSAAARTRSPAASRASTRSTGAPPTCSARPTPRSTPPSGWAGELARLEAVAGAFAEAFDAAKWAISRRRPGEPDVRTVLGSERRDRFDPEAPEVRFSVEDESYALADYPLTARVMERGGGFSVEESDADADLRERALLAEWGFTAVTAAAALAPDGSAWMVELFSDGGTHALPSALPELRLLTAEAVGRPPAPGYPAVTSPANVSKTST